MRVTLTCLLCLSLLPSVMLCRGAAADDELNHLINSVRGEVRVRPAVIEDLPRRLFLLNRWAWMLFEQGMDVNKVYPWQKAIDIDRVGKSNPQEAMTTVAAAYADLERFVAAYKENPTENKHLIQEINKTRRELKTTPTNVANLKHRIDCLNHWARLLMSRGFGAGRIYTFETAMMLTSYAETQPETAFRLTEGLFAALQELQATPVITSHPPTAVITTPYPPPPPSHAGSPKTVVTVKLKLNAPSALVTEGVAVYDSRMAMTNINADFKSTRIEYPPLTPSVKGDGYMQANDGAISLDISTVPVFVEPVGMGQGGCAATPEHSPFGMLAGDFDSLGSAGGQRYAGNLAANLPFKQIRFIGPNGLHFILYRDGAVKGGGTRYLDKMKPLYDDAISKGLNVMLTIDPSTARVAPGAFNKRGEFAKDDVKPYVEFLETVMRKYPKVRDYVLDTEADASWQPETYANVLAITYKTIKGRCRNCRLTTSGLFKRDLVFYERVLETLKQKKVKKAFDFFDMWHPYGGQEQNIDSVDEYEQIRQSYNDTVTLLERYGYFNVPIFIGETGYPSDSHDPHLSADVHSESRQARELIKRFVTAIAIGVKRVYWATTVDYHRFGGIQGYFDYTGLIHNPENKQLSHKKSAYYSYRLLIEKLSCFENAMVTRIPNLSGAVGYKFEKGNRAIYVLWADEPDQ
ncbi:MAG: hypothetical protein HQL04_06280 [Nitrospirae bacterium]|nr:hypothetical protein [Nitrospirota bacterium]